jgi:uncharacterized protein YoxC
MSGGELAALIAAIAFAVLVLLAAIPLLKLGRTLDEATLAIRKTHEGTAPILDEAQGALTQVNTQLVHVDGIAKNVGTISSNAAAMSAVVSSTLGNPMIKAAAFSYGVRKTLKERRAAEAVKSARRRHRAGKGRH